MDWTCRFTPDFYNIGRLDRVLACFGASAEVLTNQGREFLGAFEELCTKTLIDHRTTSRDHPHADGLAERVV